MDPNFQHKSYPEAELARPTSSLIEDRQRTFTTCNGTPYKLKEDRYSSHSVILSYLREGKGQRVLDVGAAQGDLAKLLTERGYEVTAVEGVPALAELAKGKCHKVIVTNLDEPVPDLGGPFDVVVYGDVLEHLKDPLAALVNINEQLKSDGVVIVSVPNSAHAWVRLQMLFGRFEYAERGILDKTHLRFFTFASFRVLVHEAGLEIERLKTTPAPLQLVVPERFHGGLLRAAQALNAGLARAWKTMFAYQFVALTRRRASS
jgi:2-polyprenyl-3-methyl-5-hydroxy-6-metoxy-1,4-benzoquinol methylase